jgi:hypothetical protein
LWVLYGYQQARFPMGQMTLFPPLGYLTSYLGSAVDAEIFNITVYT